MDIKKAYDIWSQQYDNNNNKTRDLEAFALRETLANIHFNFCLEAGCGTGKNTEWLLTKAKQITAVDLSEDMLVKAKEKIKSDNVEFVQADINQKWTFTNRKYDLVCFSLVLEHIENLDMIFKQILSILEQGGYVYIGEIHPFKQYSGSKAKFETEKGIMLLPSFTHNITDFIQPAKQYGLEILDIREYFDDGNKKAMPRVLTMLFRGS